MTTPTPTSTTTSPTATTSAMTNGSTRKRLRTDGDEHSDDTGDEKEGRASHHSTTITTTTTTTSTSTSAASGLQDLSLVAGSTAAAVPSHLHCLRLEAIFHPKFENERIPKGSSSRTVPKNDIRQAILDRVQQQQQQQQQNHSSCGFVEVSLKHSGSLLLWSGGQRYYSKNATDNLYTHVGEILLRQHFARAWWWNHKDKDATSTMEETKYQECSVFVERHRLTLAFEVVTSMLGHHGALPHRDFLILTAIADRQNERFFTTQQVLDLCQQYRLPHNDVWAFWKIDSVQRLFHLYDTTRETGMAEDTIEALTDAADAHVPSLYPHVEFQGSLLEGIVIRYVANDTNDDSMLDTTPWEDGLASHHLEAWRRLATQADELLDAIPPTMPPCFELWDKQALSQTEQQPPPVLTTDIRTLANLQEDVRQILNGSDRGHRRVAERYNQIDALQLVRHLPTTVDDETKRIAELFSTLDSLDARINYSVVKEISAEKASTRWLCTIHVLFDATHQKFRLQRREGGMELFRGFTIELDCGDQAKDTPNESADALVALVSTPHTDESTKDSLMLKMKFLPYMVRTFGCRNGLSVIASKGSAAFNDYALNLMTKWGISQDAILRWQPFFVAWGVYAKACLDGESKEYINSDLPPLTSANYLYHLDHFIKTFKAGKISCGPTGNYRGLIVVVSLTKEKANFAADYIASALGGLRRASQIKAIKSFDLTLACVPNGGVVYCACIEDGVRNVRRHLKTHANSIFLVLYGCDEASIDSVYFKETESEQKKRKGEVHAWRKTRCAVFEMGEGALATTNKGEERRDTVNTSVEFDTILKALVKASAAIPVPDARPGLLVFFVGIPGCGKSTLSRDETKEQLERRVRNFDDAHARKIEVLVGDEMKTKYWSKVGEVRGTRPSSIVVADRNAPPSAWKAVGMASISLGMTVPVLPDDAALSTTVVTGIQMPDGSVRKERVHSYPFSLHYLAVCIARVLSRLPGSHAGKLDCATENACMIVVKFYAMYRKERADDMFRSIQAGVHSATASLPVRIPFFASRELPKLPGDLEDALLRAIRVQYGYELAERDKDKDVGTGIMEAMEKELRIVLGEHSSMLLSLAAEESVSQEAFVSQIAELVSKLPSDATVPRIEESTEPQPIDLASIDIPVDQVHHILRANQNQIDGFLKNALPTYAVADSASVGRFAGDQFVVDTHVTMGHKSETTQLALRMTFGDVIGESVEVAVTGMLYNEHIAALAVVVADHTCSHKPVPACQNAFPHLTVWCDKDTQSFQSKGLPALVEIGAAVRIEFMETITLRGRLSFWGPDRVSHSNRQTT